eukprot:Nitzschia sp. Nitz4//scaffold109_size72162//45964//48252//NITZ4_005851-RA/size72162-processed-gene-0.32-mRNA-1//-1//CDS//3329532778//664//frame0
MSIPTQQSKSKRKSGKKKKRKSLQFWAAGILGCYSLFWVTLSHQWLDRIPSSSQWNLSNNNPDDFSACLLVMDDSHFLSEWLPYHYHVTNLRRLILVMDPQSQTSPRPLLDQWRERINITMWRDGDFTTKAEFQEAHQIVRNYFSGTHISPTLSRHRTRQRLFYYKCLQALQKEGRHWTMLTDTDEFLAVNYKAVKEAKLLDGLKTPDQPGAVATFVNQYTSKEHLVQTEAENPLLYYMQSSPCVQVPRLRFGAGVESPQDRVQHLVPKRIYNGSDFLTLRWRSHTTPEDYIKNKISKALLDLSRIPLEDIAPVDSIHLPIRSLCQQRRLHTKAYESPLAIHHYLGSYEQYTYRENDARLGKERSKQKWEEYNRIANPQTDDDQVRPWLSGFHQNNPQDAPALLQGVGKLLPKSWTTYWGNPNEERCALCFFGLPRAYKDIVLPSLIQNVLIPNARHNCDVFVHFYKQYDEKAGRKNSGGSIDPDQVFSLKEAVLDVQAKHGPPQDARTHRVPTVMFTLDTEEDFWKKHKANVDKFLETRNKDGNLRYYPYLARTYEDSSIVNIVKQWHSIQMSFKLMELAGKQFGFNYTRVDAMFLTPIDIALLDKGKTDSRNDHVVTATFGMNPVNDRMVYGPFQAVKVWATQRFEMIDDWAKQEEAKGWVMHSERFLNGSIFPKIESMGVSMNVNKDICFVRTRADVSVLVSDCHIGGITRGWMEVDRRAVVEGILGHNCTRFRIGPKFVGLGCGHGYHYADTH